MWTLCGSQKPHKQRGSLALFWVWHDDFSRSLQQVRCSHLFRLIHTRVWYGKQTYDGSLGEKFLAHLQLKRNLSPTQFSSAQHIFHGAHLSCFWESVCLCLLLGQHSGRNVTSAFMWDWVPPCHWETSLLLPSEHSSFVMRPAVLVFIPPLPLSWSNIYSPLIDLCARFTALWPHQPSEAQTLAFLKDFFGVPAVSAVIEIHKYVSHKACSNIFSRFRTTYVLYPVFLPSVSHALKHKYAPFLLCLESTKVKFIALVNSWKSQLMACTPGQLF